MKTNWLWLGLLSTAILLSGCEEKKKKKKHDDDDVKEKKEEVKDPFETVTLSTMQADYRKNAAEAAKKYQKKIRVSGTVNDTLDYQDSKWIFVNTEIVSVGTRALDDTLHVICKLKDAGQLAHGTKGSNITVRALNLGQHSFSKNFVFADCVVEGKPDTDKAAALPDKSKPGDPPK